MIARLHTKLFLLWGFKKFALSFLLGVLAAFSMPPYGAFPVLFISFPLFIWLLEGAISAGSKAKMLKHSFWLGWFFGFGYFLNSLWWIGAAFLVDPEKFAVFLPFAVVAMPAGLALFYGFAAMLTRALWGNGVVKILSFTFSFLLFEILRGNILTGFPWNLFGYALTQNPVTAQTASLIGVYGLTAITLFLFALPALFVEEISIKKTLFATVAILLLMLSFGVMRLINTPTSYVDKITLRLVQANIAQDAKFNRRNKDSIVDKYLALSDQATSSKRTGLSDVTHLIWSESAFPFFLQQEKEVLLKIAKTLPSTTILLTGGVRMGELLPNTARPPVYNSIFALNNQAEFVAVYDKIKLVPFGEFLPFQSALESIGLRQLTQVIGGFSAGTSRQVMSLPSTPPLSPLVCYEAIFPQEVSAFSPKTRPQWILNVTNDAWFGITPGPHQHFHMAQVRAIEEGIPVVRAANNGISAIVDPLGRITAQLALGETGVVDGALPNGVPPPFATLLGRLLPWLLLGLLGSLLIISRKITR